MSEKAKLIRGDPPKIDFKKKGEPPKKEKIWNPGFFNGKGVRNEFFVRLKQLKFGFGCQSYYGLDYGF